MRMLKCKCVMLYVYKMLMQLLIRYERVHVVKPAFKVYVNTVGNVFEVASASQ